MIQTEVTRLFGIQYPLFQGGMAWVSDARLAAAVSNAGGLGIISAMNLSGDYLRQQIQKCRELTQQPFGVNLMLMSPFVQEAAQVVLEERVPVVTTGAGFPGPYMKKWIPAGIQVVPVIPSVALAKRVEREGACAVVAEGCEAGGHIGELTTMALIPQVAEALSVPVLAAGGIADGRGVAAAFMLGAQGVQCGTRFLASQECPIHDNYKNRVIAAKDIDTMVTGRRLGHPVRALKSPYMNAFRDKEQDPGISNEELEAFGSGALRRAALEGDLETGCFMAGQSAGLVHACQPVETILREMFTQAEECLRGASAWVK